MTPSAWACDRLECRPIPAPLELCTKAILILLIHHMLWSHLFARFTQNRFYGRIILLMHTTTLILFVLGFVLLIGGAELLVRGASKLAVAIGISPLVVGLTVVAYGTSSPELAVTLNAAFAGRADLAFGNIIGSNISNTLLVLGLASAFVALTVDRRLILLEVPLMIGVSFLVLIMGMDGVIHRYEGIVLVLGAISYTVIVIRKSRRENIARQIEMGNAFDENTARIKKPWRIAFQIVLIVVGLALLVVGSDWLIDGAVVIAELLGVNQLVIGLTIVAVGTSLPEIATSLVAGFRGQRDIAVGNVVGSNIFNLLLVLGVTSAVAPAGIEVSKTALHFDIPVMIAASLLLLPIFFTHYRIDRWEGVLFLGFYGAYTVHLFLNATGNTALERFDLVMSFIIPITAIALIILTIRAFRNPGNKKPG